MTCVRIGDAIAGLGFWILAGARGRAMSCMTAKTLQRRLQVAFGVDQEVRGDHDLLALGQSVEDLDPIATAARSEEHTSELQSLMRISYAVFCLKKKTQTQTTKQIQQYTNNNQ